MSLVWVISSESGLKQKLQNNPLLPFQNNKKKGGKNNKEAYMKTSKAPNTTCCISINALERSDGKMLSRLYKLNIVYPSWVFTVLLLWCQSNSCSSCSSILPHSTGTCCGQGSENPQRCNLLLITLAWLWQPAMQHSVGGMWTLFTIRVCLWVTSGTWQVTL